MTMTSRSFALPLDHGARAHRDLAAAGAVGLPDAAAAIDESAGRKIRTGNDLHRCPRRPRSGLFDEMNDRFADLREIVRRHVRRHADGDSAAAVDQQVRDLAGKV